MGVADWLRILHPDDSVFEVRMLNCKAPNRKRTFTVAGWFDDVKKAEASVADAEQRYRPSGVYATINPVVRALMSRAEPNTLHEYPDNLTGDHEIARRLWLPIDVDPVRPTGVSASDGEKEAAAAVAAEVREWLENQNHWPEPVVADSGNGYHLLYRINLRNDEAGAQVCRSVLHTLGDRFDNEHATVDRKVYNSSRILKFYGTFACKGIDSETRPHRRSAVLWYPEVRNVVAADKLASIVPPTPERQQTPRVPRTGVEERARRYVERMDAAISGSDGHGATFQVAQVLVRGFDLDKSTALDLLREYNSRCQPEWTEKELRHKIDSADATSKLERGYLLSDDPEPVRRVEKPSAGATAPANGTPAVRERFKDRTLLDLATEGADTIVEVAAGLRDDPTIPTGYPDLDKSLALNPGDYVLIGARPSVGKSHFALSLMARMARSASVPSTFVSLEMTEASLADRTARSCLMIGRTNLGCDLDTLALNAEGLNHTSAELGLIQVTWCRSDLDEVEAACRRAHEVHGSKVCAVDYIQRVNTKCRTAEEEVKRISERLCQVAKDTNMVVLALCQFNRAIESRTNRAPQMSDLRGSGALEQDADAILMLHRDDNEDAELNVTIVKQRNGSLGRTSLVYPKPFGWFCDASPDGYRLLVGGRA